MGMMTTDTGRHRPDCLGFSHGFSLADIAMAGLALHVGVQVCRNVKGDLPRVKRIPVAYDRHFEIGASRDIIVVASESLANECREAHHGVSILDFTDGAHPYPIATYRVTDESINFCERGGRFGTHNVSPTYHKPFYPGFIVVSYFNAGVRVVDVRDPFHPREIAFYIPALTENTAPRCVTVDGNEHCKTAIQTNIVEVDDRGLIFLSDRANTGVHIVELTGAAEALVEGE